MQSVVALLALLVSFNLLASHSFREVAEDFLEFTERNAGIITPQQLHQAGLESVYLINVNSERQYKKGLTLPNSVNMDWRKVLKRSDEIPNDKTVVIYCNNMLYSSRAQLLLNMYGFDNILLLKGGLNNWTYYTSNLQN